MRFSLEVIRARKGDCLMLHFGTAEEPGLVLIDGGPRGVYGPHLRPRLADLRRARKLGDNQPLPVDLLMVSHVDDDHIQGILDLTKEMVERQRAHQPLPVQVLDFWHNTFDNIIGNPPDELTAAFRSQFGAAALAGELPDDATLDAGDGELDEETIVSSLKVLASIEQGSQLRSDAALLGFPLNLEFDGRLIVAEEDGPAAEIAPDLTFTVLGPTVPELKKLHAKHDAWLKALKEQHKSPPAALAAYVDKSVPNLSSIVVLAEAQGKTVLLTGDARGDKILAGLEFVGRMKKGGTMHVDVLKVPHHGSANNLTQDFFERITAEHYVFSGNGEHGNPERETLEMLRAARGDDDFTVHLTYPIDELDVERAKDWRKEQAKEKAKKKKVRPNWSPQKNSLKSFCAAHKKFADNVSIVEEGEPHVIDLLDEVEF